MAFEKLNQKIVLDNPYYKVLKEEYNLPNGKIGTYFAIRGLQTVFIIPMLSATKIIITKQFRYLMQTDSWELPAGRIDAGETPEAAALRELEEESGYRAEHLELAGLFVPCNGLSDETCYVFLATKLKKAKQKLEETEQITVYEKTVDEFDDMINNNTVRDGMTIAAWTMTHNLRNSMNL